MRLDSLRLTPKSGIQADSTTRLLVCQALGKDF